MTMASYPPFGEQFRFGVLWKAFAATHQTKKVKWRHAKGFREIFFLIKNNNLKVSLMHFSCGNQSKKKVGREKWLYVK